jgi:threonine 3-dehydrogenase
LRSIWLSIDRLNRISLLHQRRPDRESESGAGVEETPTPEIGINDVLIKVERAAICGTDLHIWKWDDWARKTIPCRWRWATSSWAASKVGSNVSDFFPGDLVSGEGHVVCGRCRNCLAGGGTCARTPRGWG